MHALLGSTSINTGAVFLVSINSTTLSALAKILFQSYERKVELEKKLDAELPEDSELLSIINLKNEILDLNYYL